MGPALLSAAAGEGQGQLSCSPDPRAISPACLPQMARVENKGGHLTLAHTATLPHGHTVTLPHHHRATGPQGHTATLRQGHTATMAASSPASFKSPLVDFPFCLCLIGRSCFYTSFYGPLASLEFGGVFSPFFFSPPSSSF